MREVRRTNRGARSGGDKSAVSTWATLSIGVVVGAVGFYADVFSKVHTAACKGLPIIGIAVGWLNCSDIDSEAIAKIDRGVKQVEQGVGRLEYGVGAIRSAVKETDARTQGIAEDIKAIQKGADPTTLARQRILASPYLPDNHGYIKAIAHGSPLIDQFDVLGIRGDETALRQEILGSPISSNEFRNLGLFLQKAPVGHYAAKVREEFAAFFAELQVTNSANALRAATCSTGPVSFVEDVMRRHLAASCPDEKAWFNATIAAIKVSAEATSYISPVSTSPLELWLVGLSNTLAYKPSSPRTLSQAELVSAFATPSPALNGQYVKAEAFIRIDNDVVGGVVELYKTDKCSPCEVVARLQLESKPTNWAACSRPVIVNPRIPPVFAPSCRALVTVRIARTGRVQSIENIRPVAPASAGPQTARPVSPW